MLDENRAHATQECYCKSLSLFGSVEVTETATALPGGGVIKSLLDEDDVLTDISETVISEPSSSPARKSSQLSKGASNDLIGSPVLKSSAFQHPDKILDLARQEVSTKLASDNESRNGDNGPHEVQFVEIVENNKAR